ncbi:MAG: hypothetical protein QOD78_1506, partial [Chloroflexota bacterium]|nr:hypothetical protein [Chloroflexota bacterium]
MSGATRSGLRVAVATDVPIVEWQARCIEALTGVPGVSLRRWIQVAPAQAAAIGGGGTGAAATAVVPTPVVLRELDPEDGADPLSADAADLGDAADAGANGDADVLLDL